MLARGLSDQDPDVLGGQVLAAWDAFLELVRDPATDLTRPSRLPGWTGRDTCVHLGSWPDHAVLTSVLASARNGGGGEPIDPDASNDRLVRSHRNASVDDVLAALVAARSSLATFFESADAAEWGRAPSHSAVGPLPVLSLAHAGCYELAVHALDLVPCGGPVPPPALLDRGLAALMDITGALCSRAGIDITVSAQTPMGGWRFISDASGWTTEPVPPGKLSGTGVHGSTADLLDTSAGRSNLAQLLLSRRLVVHQLPSFMRLAPLLHEVPGLPGGAALRGAVAGLGSVNKLLGRLRRG